MPPKGCEVAEALIQPEKKKFTDLTIPFTNGIVFVVTQVGANWNQLIQELKEWQKLGGEVLNANKNKEKLCNGNYL